MQYHVIELPVHMQTCTFRVQSLSIDTISWIAVEIKSWYQIVRAWLDDVCTEERRIARHIAAMNVDQGIEITVFVGEL